MPGQHADINGTRIYYEDVGAGDPIIFSHCLLWNTTLYDAQVAELSKSYRCISYDHRGQGKSADHDCNVISVEMLCEDIAALISHLQLPAVHFVGHSLGGFVGIMLAARHPELVRSLVLCNTSGDEERPFGALSFKLLNAVGRVLGPKLLAPAVVPLIFHSDALTSAERRAKLTEPLANNRNTAWRAINGVIYRPSQYASLSKIRARTLVVTADGDKMRTRKESDRLAAGIPGADLVCLRRGRHMLPLEQPEKITELIRDFISKG